MSHSVKKTIYCGDRKTKRDGWSFKTDFNRRNRRKPIDDEEVAPRAKMEYKKENESWDIHDCSWLGSDFCTYYRWRERRCAELGKKVPSKKEAYRDWYKLFRMK